MSQIEYIHYVEIPIRVYAEYQKEERATRHYPGCPSAIGVDDIEILTEENGAPVADLESLKNYLLVRYGDEFAENAWNYR